MYAYTSENVFTLKKAHMGSRDQVFLQYPLWYKLEATQELNTGTLQGSLSGIGKSENWV